MTPKTKNSAAWSDPWFACVILKDCQNAAKTIGGIDIKFSASAANDIAQAAKRVERTADNLWWCLAMAVAVVVSIAARGGFTTISGLATVVVVAFIVTNSVDRVLATRRFRDASDDLMRSALITVNDLQNTASISHFESLSQFASTAVAITDDPAAGLMIVNREHEQRPSRDLLHVN